MKSFCFIKLIRISPVEPQNRFNFSCELRTIPLETSVNTDPLIQWVKRRTIIRDLVPWYSQRICYLGQTFYLTSDSHSTDLKTIFTGILVLSKWRLFLYRKPRIFCQWNRNYSLNWKSELRNQRIHCLKTDTIVDQPS